MPLASAGSRSPGPFSRRARELQQSDTLSPLSSRAPTRSPSRTPPQLFEPSQPGPPPGISSSSGTAPPTVLLPTVDENFAVPAPVLSSPPGLSRRPRADTLPSTFHLASSSAPSTHHHLPATSGPLRHLSSGLLGPPAAANGGAISLPASGTSTPISEYPFATPSTALLGGAAGSSLHSPSSRLRSGSLTLPNSGLSNAFGPTLFPNGGGAAWPTQSISPGPSTTTPTPLSASSPASMNGTTHTNGVPSSSSGRSDLRAEEVRSPDSSTYGDDSHVRTLDYLGLDGDSGDSPLGPFGPFSEALHPAARALGTIGDSPLPPLPSQQRPASHSLSLHHHAPGMHRLGSVGNLSASHLLSSPSSSAAADAVEGLLHHGRMRSNTVAVFPRTASVSSAGGTSPFPLGVTVNDVVKEEDAGSYFNGVGGGGPAAYHHHQQSSDSSDSTRLLYQTTESVSTPAGTGADADGKYSLLGVAASSARARAATIGILDESRETFLRKRAGTTAGALGHQHPPQDELQGLGRRIRGLSLSQEEAPWTSSRPITPDPHTLSPATQVPTRSLWIGNLDPKTTPAELQALFAPYGAIESLRLVPDKECGFVNFVSVADATRAKEDVLNRLGGQLAKGSGMVRIGFGKPEGGAGPAGGGTTGRGLGAMEMPSQSAPTRALWVGSIPSSTTPNHLLAIFGPFGPIESARVLTHKSCGFINFERFDDAVSARKALNGREILGAEHGAVRIGFAKVPPKVVGSPYGGPDMPLPLGRPPDTVLQQDYRHPLVAGLGQAALGPAMGMPGMAYGRGMENTDGDVPVEMHDTVVASVADMQMLMSELAGDTAENDEHVKLLALSRASVTYHNVIPQAALSDPAIARRYGNADAPRLRDIRKRLDSPQISNEEIDDIARELLPECVSLSSDYIGNTLIQKIFERASFPTRFALLERIAPHLATIGTHKNGTWAVQKIIQCVQEHEEFDLVQKNLRSYTPPLLLNDFGNYVVQGALRFGPPTSDFIFDAMVDRCWEIGSGRFGARSTRQTLESPLASRYQVKRVAVAIVLNAIPLATNSNGALLITWLLETSNFPGRYRLLAPRFAPHLTHLCTHKLASLAVLKIINQRIDPKASRLILDSLFDPDAKTLEDILGDQMHGAQCLTKIMGSSFLDASEREVFGERVKGAIVTLRVQANPAYRKLMEDLGMAFQGPPPPPPPSAFPMPFQPQPQLQQSGSPVPSWSPQLGYSPYPQFDYSGYYSPYQQYAAHGGPPYTYHQIPPQGFPQQQNYAMTPPSGRSHAASPMLAPVAMPASAGPFSPTLMPSGLPAVSSPDPFSILRVSTGDPHAGFHPSFQNAFASPVPQAAYPYYRPQPPFGASPESRPDGRNDYLDNVIRPSGNNAGSNGRQQQH